MADTMIVILSNSAGELCRRVVNDSEAAARAVVEMVEEAGELYPLDSITIHYADPTKIDESMVRVIRGMLASGKTVRGTAAELGINRSTVGHISSGRAWSHVK